MRSREFRDWSHDHEARGRRSWRDRPADEGEEERGYRGRESYEQQYRAGQGGMSDMWDRPTFPRSMERRDRENESDYGRGDNWDQRYRSGEYERYGSDADYGRDRDPRRSSYTDVERGGSYGYGPTGDRRDRSAAQQRDFGYGNRFSRDRDEDQGNPRGYGSGSYTSRAAFGGGAYEGGGYGPPGMSLDEGRFTTRPQQHGQGRRIGNAPKGYKRSDDRIREDVCDRLSERWDVDSHQIEVSVSNGEVTLSGSVPERGMKFRAETISDGVNGVTEVHNQLRVVPPGREAHGSQHGQGAQQGQSQTEPHAQARDASGSSSESFKNNATHAGKRS